MRGVGTAGHLRVELFGRYYRPDVTTEAAVLEDPGDVSVTGEKSKIPGLVEKDRVLCPQPGVGGIRIIQKRFVVSVEARRPIQFSPLR